MEKLYVSINKLRQIHQTFVKIAKKKKSNLVYFQTRIRHSSYDNDSELESNQQMNRVT